SKTYTVTLTPLGGFTGTVSFTASGLPGGTTFSFNPTSVNLANLDFVSTDIPVTFTTSASTPAETYTITVTGTSGAVSHSDTVTLSVADYSLSATPSSSTVVVGNSASYTVTGIDNNGFTGNISLSASGLPGGASASFSPSSIPAGGSSTLIVATSAATTPGVYTLTISGSSGGLVRTKTVSLTVNPPPDFSLSASPASLTIAQGTSGTSTITENDLNGFTGSVSLSASGLPP